MKDQDQGSAGKEHGGIPGAEMKPTPELSAARPGDNHPEIRPRAIRIMAQDLAKWAGIKDPDSQCIKAAEELFDLNHEYDGFQLARMLERMGWDGDESLVEVCGGKSACEMCAKDELIREWVKAENIQMPFTVGQPITKYTDAVICGLNHELATITYRFNEGRGIGWANIEDVTLRQDDNAAASAGTT